MKVMNNSIASYPKDPIRFFNFEKFEERANDCFLFIGAHPSEEIFKPMEFKKIFFSTEEQWTQTDGTDKYVPYVDEILTICPLAEGRRAKRRFAFFPIDPVGMKISSYDKKFDVVYAGLASNTSFVQNIINTISKFNYRFVSYDNIMGKATDIDVSYAEKLDVIASSKICIVHNLINEKHPQLKSRAFEAAFCKSLILCKRDNFGTMEKWFNTNDFLYYDNDAELESKIRHILVNFKRFEPIAENAFNTFMNNLTTEKFIEKFIGWK